MLKTWVMHMMALILVCAASNRPANGQEPGEDVSQSPYRSGERLDEREREIDLEFFLDSVWFSKTDGGDLDVSTSRIGAGVEAEYALSAKLSLTGTFGVERSFYDIDGLSQTVPGVITDDIDVLDEYSFSVGARYVASRDLAYFARGSLSYAFEGGANLPDAIKSGLILGARYRHSREVGLRFGLAAFTRIEENALIFPVLGLDWQPDEDWTVRVGFPETRVERHLNDSISLYLGGRFDFRDYRLDRLGTWDDAVFREDMISLEVGSAWQISERGELRLGVGLPVYREVSFDDSSGHELADENLDISPYLSLSLKVGF